MNNEENKKKNSFHESLSTLDEELIKLMEDPKLTGEIKDDKNPLVIFIKAKGQKLKKSRIRYSYTDAQTLWMECKKIETKDNINKFYLIRITSRVQKNTKDRIRKEYEIHQNCESLNNISPKFLCYYLSDFLNFSVFMINDFYTLDEILEKKELPSFSNDSSMLEFSKEELISASAESINSLYLDGKYFIVPFLTSSNLLYIESSMKKYFLFSEIFLYTDSPEKEIEFELKNKELKNWLTLDFVKNKAQLSFASNISCLGNIFYKIVFNENPKIPIKVEENSIYKELIENCLKTDKKQRWNIEELLNYIYENSFEEEKRENDIKEIKNDIKEKEDKGIFFKNLIYLLEEEDKNENLKDERDNNGNENQNKKENNVPNKIEEEKEEDNKPGTNQDKNEKISMDKKSDDNNKQKFEDSNNNEEIKLKNEDNKILDAKNKENINKNEKENDMINKGNLNNHDDNNQNNRIKINEEDKIENINLQKIKVNKDNNIIYGGQDENFDEELNQINDKELKKDEENNNNKNTDEKEIKNQKSEKLDDKKEEENETNKNNENNYKTENINMNNQDERINERKLIKNINNNINEKEEKNLSFTPEELIQNQKIDEHDEKKINGESKNLKEETNTIKDNEYEKNNIGHDSIKILEGKNGNSINDYEQKDEVKKNKDEQNKNKENKDVEKERNEEEEEKDEELNKLKMEIEEEKKLKETKEKELLEKQRIKKERKEQENEIKIHKQIEELEKQKKLKEEEEIKEKKKLEKEKERKEKLAKMREELENTRKQNKELEEKNKKMEEEQRIEKEKEAKRIKEEEEKQKLEEKKKKEEIMQKMKEREEKERLEKLEMDELEKENKKLKEELEKNKKIQEKREEEEKKEKEKQERERLKKEEKEREKLKKEEEEKQRLEIEEKENERKRQEILEQKLKQKIKYQEQIEKQEEEQKKEEERKKLEEIKKKNKADRIKREEEHAKNFPDGISSTRENNANKKKKFIHLEIKFNKSQKEIEIFDIYGPTKPGYKFEKIEKDKYWVIFPFYKINKLKTIIFGIRDISNNNSIDDNDISGKYLSFNNSENYWELSILKTENCEMIFNIFNVPKEIDKINYLKFLNKINLKDYTITLYCVREVTSIYKFTQILDLIMELGKNNLSKLLITIIIERKIDFLNICHYLESNKNSKFKNNFFEIAPEIIYELNSKNIGKDEGIEVLDKDEENYGERKALLCLDNNIPINLYQDNYQKDLIEKTSENLGKFSIENKNNLELKKEEISKKIFEFNKNQTLNGLKEITCILTDTTVKKLSQLEYGIQANIPMLIQGFTSAGKSFLSIVASKINKRECLSTALSEHTTIEDLLGRNVIKKNSIKFIPGILLLAYKDGKTLILDECDLAKPNILSCILGSMTKDELIICNQTFRKMEGYNIILTMNGEVKGFNEKQRNILTSNILSKFNLIQFDEMEKEECQEIFKSLLNQNKSKNSSNYIDKIDIFIEIHQKMINEMKMNIKSIDPIVTLRNLKYCCYLSQNKIHPRIAAELSYTARFPKKERKDFDKILNKFGDITEDDNLKNEIEKNIKNNFLFYNETYKKVIYLALTAIKEGLNPLIIGEKGCGLTTLAKFVASILSQDYEFLLCSSETSAEDLIGCYQPSIKTKEKIQDLSTYIKWCDGPVPRAGKKGVPLILDNINYSRPQVIECLNPLLEDNSKYNNVEYNILEKENEGPIKMEKGFCIIGTMIIDKDNKHSISKALMNRFVAIYVDNDIEINNLNLKFIIENICKKLDKEINSKNLDNNKEENQNRTNDENEYLSSDNDSSNEENNEISDDNDDQISEESKKEKEENELKNKEIPKWYNIKNISEQTISEIITFLENEKIKGLRFKEIVKKITKLALVYERINKFKFTMKDCYEFIDLKFNENNLEKYKTLQKNILLESQVKKNIYFFDDFNSDSWKMIMSLISSNISNTSIFLQGSPGSGKSCAARHFGAYRIFQNRNPILSVNCNRDLKFDYLVGNFNFKDSKFNFIDGPLITAMKKGECLLLDEFNLCPENVLINLLPIFKANINDEIYLKGVPDKIHINPGFLLIATGNVSKEKGRNIISSMILDEILTIEINSSNLVNNTSLIKNILENEYSEIYQDENSFEIDKISSEQIKKIIKILEDIQFKLSLRQIKCLLDRITRFCLDENFNVGGFKKIPVIYVIISYIIPQLKIGKKKLKEFLEKLDEIMKYNNAKELMEFISSKVEFETTFIKLGGKKEEQKFIKKGNIYLNTNINENKFPQVAKQAYFWLRMSCSLKDESPSSENILLAGTTSYKEYLLKEWLSIKIQKDIAIDTFSLTRNTEIENLIGTSSLDDENKLDIQIKDLEDSAILYFDLGTNKLNENDNYDEKFRLIKKKKKEKLCLNYIYENISKLKNLKRSFNQNNEQIGLKTVTSFNLGIVPKAFIFGKKLILKGIENPESSVIERLNPILENPRYLIITEDNQEIFNDDKIFKKIYKDDIKSVPLNNLFRIFFTSREVFQVKLSKALTSRLTIINCPNYDNENYLNIELNPEINYEIICKSIVDDKNLVKEMSVLNKTLIKTEKVKIEFLRFIRWCKSTKNIYDTLKKIKFKTVLYKDDSLNYKYIIGISALRSILDRYDSKYRECFIKNNLKDYLPEKLFNLLTSELNKDLESCPLEFKEKEGKKYIYSIYSGIILEFPENKTPNFNSLKNIKWTKSSVDIADAILVAMISNTILILEGPPGRGKTAISKAIFNFLTIDGDNLKRINFSPSTIIEDVFARTIPHIEDEKVSTERKVQGLLSILENSQNSEIYFRHGLILDEINLASDTLLEYLYSYLDSIIKREDYISPDGTKYKNIGNIGIIATMNDAKLSNSRTYLSNSFINRCHLFKLPDYSPNEKLLLAKNIFESLNKEINTETFMRIMKCFQISEKISSKYSGFSGTTFRDILKLNQFIDRCEEIPIDYLLELILGRNIPQSEMNNFQEKTGLNMISNSLNDLKLKIEKNYLCFDKFIKYKLINPRKYEIKEQFTISQKEALMKMMIGLLAERPILLIGDIGTGKTFIVEKFANLIGVNLKVIQFNSETTSLDILGRLELCIAKEKINKLKMLLKHFIAHLIELRYSKITEIIVESEFFESDISRIQTFLEKEKQSFLKLDDNDIQKEYNQIRFQLKSLNGIKITNFDFKLSALVKAMKEGDWVLLDDINFAPQEIEGLMSLLEEEPTLKIYENSPPLFFTKDKTRVKNKNSDYLIHPNFRLIMTTSKETNISSAIKSRCLCIQIKPFKEAKDYGELIANNLKYSDIADKNIIDIAKKIGYAFYKLKEKEDQSNYILKNYILSSVNLVNLSKLIIFLQPIDAQKLSLIIEFCIFTSFKKYGKKNNILKLFKKYLQEDINFEITPIRNIKRSHEYYLKRCEINIFSYYYINNKEINDILKDMNKKIESLFENKKIKELKENIINKDINLKEILTEIPRKNLLENLESFTLPEINEYIGDISEVIMIMQGFLKEKDKLYTNLYFLNYLKKILMELSSIKEENLNGIKINKMKCDKEFFLKYNIKERQAKEYTNKLIRFKNMIYYFEEFIPKEISILDMENCIFALYYKYYKTKYKSEFKKDDNFKKYFPFLLLEDDNLRDKIKRLEFKNADSGLSKLFNILKFYEKTIEFDIKNKKLFIPYDLYSISLIETKNININEIKEKLNINTKEIVPKIIFDEKIITYYYPKQFYEEDKLLQIFFFFELFSKDYINYNYLEKIIPKELFEFNSIISSILVKNQNYLDNGEKMTFNSTYNFKDIIKIGYKTLEAIKNVEKNNIKFSKGINLFEQKDKNYLDSEEGKINIILENINIIKKYLNDPQLWPSINNKYKILEEKKKIFIYENEKSELKSKLRILEQKYNIILKDETFVFLQNEKKQIENEIKENKNKEEIEALIKNFESKLKKLKESEEHNNEYPQDNKSIKQNTISSQFLYIYSKLFSIIDEFSNIKTDTKFYNRVYKFQKLMKNYGSTIDLFVYKEQIFSECQKGSFVSNEIVEIFKHIANSFLISQIIKNNLETKFVEYLKKMIEIDETIINDINGIFNLDEYIYFPEFTIKDIIYCFRYGNDDYKSGELNPTFRREIINEKDESYSNREQLIKIINKYFKKSSIKPSDLQLIENYLSKINIFYDNKEKIKYDININWLIKPLEKLKKEAIKYPNRIIVNNKYGYSEDNQKELYDGKKILVKVLNALFEGNQKIKTIYNENSILNNLIVNFQNVNKNFPYGFRIMVFYDFYLFEDNESKTMKLIIETIDSILKSEFRFLSDDIDMKNICQKVYEEFIDIVLSKENPKFEVSKSFHFFEILFYSFLKKLKNEYQKQKNTFNNNLKQYFNKTNIVIEEIESKINSKVFEYKKLYNQYKKDQELLEKEIKINANKFYDDRLWIVKKYKNWKYSGNYDKIKDYTKSNEYNSWINKRQGINKPIEDSSWDINKKKISNIKSKLNALKNMDDIEESKKIILSITNEIKSIKIDYKESNHFSQFLEIFDNLNNDIECLKSLNRSNKFLSKNIPINIALYEIKENSVYSLTRIIQKCESYFSLFNIKNISIKDNNKISIYISNNVSEKQGSNFIFKKGDNKPVFLNKNMKINLGLYIIGSDLKNIGSFIIQNNYNNKLKYSIKQNPNNEIRVFLNEEGLELEPYQDLQINLYLNNSVKTPGFYTSKFELILSDENIVFDKCQVHALINLIPMIIRFSIPNEKYSILNDNKNCLSISHPIKDLTIFHSFPGNYCSERLGIEITNNVNKVGYETENMETKGKIVFKPYFDKNKEFMKFQFSLSLLSSTLLNFKVEYKNPSLYGLVIFDENNLYLTNIMVIKNTKKNIFLFNMSNENIHLNFYCKEREINLNYRKNIIEPKEIIKVGINISNIKYNTELKICNKSIKIQVIEQPFIIKHGTSFEIKCNDFEVLEKNYFREMRFVSIDTNFKITKENINSLYEFIYDKFSVYLVFNNNILKESIGKYQFYKDKYRKIYGFSVKEEFGVFKLNDPNLKLALSDKVEYFQEYKNIFDEVEKRNFKLKFKENISKIASDNIKDINIGIYNLIDQKINLLDENSINNLKISAVKISIVNIIIFLLKYSLKYDNSNKFRDYLQKIFDKMFSRSKREIKQIFIPKIIEGKKIKILDNLSYLFSFVLLIISPGELLEYEYKEEINNIKNEDIDIKKTKNYKKLEIEFDNYINNLKNDKILNNDIIYHSYNNTITLHEENDEFSKYEKQIIESDIKVDEKTEQETFEFVNSCYNEIELIKNDINKNNINISNLLLFLERCKKILYKIPFIITKKENEEQIKICINGIQFIHDYLNELIKTGIMKTKFGEILKKYFEEYNYFLSKFKSFSSNDLNLSKNIHLKYISKCELPSDNRKDNITNYDNSRNIFNEDKNLMSNIDMEQYVTEINENEKYDNYENKKDYNVENKEDNVKIINQINLSEKDIKLITIEGINDDFKIQLNLENNMNKSKFNLNNDLTDFKEEVFKFEDISKLFKDLKNITATNFLKNILKIISDEKQKYSQIKDINKIENLIQKFDASINNNSEFYKNYNKSSSRLQNIISNLIRKKILVYNENEILPFTLKNSYLDILVDISSTMSENQRIASLLITTGLSLAFSKYGVKIRISVFSERGNVWVLNNEFSEHNIKSQLSRLRDALSFKKRIVSFPADALKKLKNSFGKYENKYCQILISNLISAQIADKKLDWNELGQRIIIFGLKSIFEEDFLKDNPKIYENILKVPTSNQAQIIQEFFVPEEIISQSEKIKDSYSKLINGIIDTLLDKNEEIEEFNIRDIITNHIDYPRNSINNNDIEDLKELIGNNLKEQNYFSQNIPFSMLNLSKFQLNKIPQNIKIPSLTELEKISSRNIFYNKNYSLDEIITYIISILTPLFRHIMPSNIASGKIPCTSGGSLSIQGIKKWICSGFTYTYIFEKQGGKNKKKYNLSYVIDLSKSAFLLCNYSHCIATIILLLIAPSTVEDNEDIFIDVIINTFYGVKIVDFNSKCTIFQNISKINEIINILNEEINYSCCPGSCVYAAYQLLAERREDKKIFLITDGFVSNSNEIRLILSLIENCENEGIELVTIGVGTFPNGIKEVYPNSCYAPSIRNLQDALFSCFSYSKDSFSYNFEPNLILTEFNEEIKKKLTDNLNEKPKDKILEESINSQPITVEDMLQNENSAMLEGFEKIVQNPEEEPYRNIFDDCKILIVILYLGNDKHDKNITTEIFEKNAGISLKLKGFKYDIVYSYGEGIKKLSTPENNICPYSELWLFCSKGDGSLPEKAEDKDSNKISQFLEMVADFNSKGGALFLFCDNYPYVLEANLLLKEYIKFDEGKINFEMKGSYNNENPDERFIYQKGTKDIKYGYFQPDHFLKSPGKAERRLSLRIGLYTFSEGITLSYAQTFDNSENYNPFIPFAYLSDPEHKRPFILYYDPKIETGRGPIVLHGGFTSAFYDFQQNGTGRLVISIACWLIRKEEKYLNMAEGKTNDIQRIPIPPIKNIKFDKWIKAGSESMFSILILDVSGSMEKYYAELLNMANEIIKNQMKNDENEGVIILFATYAKTIIDGKYRLLYLNDINKANVGTGTNFNFAFQEAKKYIYNKQKFNIKRILFLTDGKSDSSKLQIISDEMKNENFQINIVGFENNNNPIFNFIRMKKIKTLQPGHSESSFEHLRKFASPNCFFTSKNFKDIENICKNIFAADY